MPRRAVASVCLFILAGALLLSQGGPARAAGPKRPSKAPEGFSALQGRYPGLAGRWSGLVSAIRSQRAQCSRVRSDQTALIASCKAQTSDIQQRWKRYNTDLDRYESARSRALDSREKNFVRGILQVRKRMARTREKLSFFAKNPGRHEKDFQEWTELGTKAREKALGEAKEAVVSLVLKTLAIKKEAAIQLTNQQRGSIKLLLKNYGPILKYANQFSAQRLASLKSDAEVIKTLGDIHTAIDLSATAFSSPDDREKVLTAISKILGVFVKDPRLGLLLTDAGIVTAAGYGWTKGIVSRRRVDQLLDLTGKELSEVEALSRLHREDVRRLKALERKKEELRKARGADESRDGASRAMA